MVKTFKYTAFLLLFSIGAEAETPHSLKCDRVLAIIYDGKLQNRIENRLISIFTTTKKVDSLKGLAGEFQPALSISRTGDITISKNKGEYRTLSTTIHEGVHAYGEYKMRHSTKLADASMNLHLSFKTPNKNLPSYEDGFVLSEIDARIRQISLAKRLGRITVNEGQPQDEALFKLDSEVFMVRALDFYKTATEAYVTAEFAVVRGQARIDWNPVFSNDHIDVVTVNFDLPFSNVSRVELAIPHRSKNFLFGRKKSAEDLKAGFDAVFDYFRHNSQTIRSRYSAFAGLNPSDLPDLNEVRQDQRVWQELARVVR